MIVLPQQAAPARRWLAHLVRASETVSARPQPFADPPPFDTADVLGLARRERVAPLLHLGSVAGRIVDELPDDFRAACEAHYYRTLHKNIVALKTGRRILDALRCAGVAAAPLGGWAVLQGPLSYYPDPGARPLEDLEVMVREPERSQAEAVLAELGYRRSSRRDAAIRSGHELAFRQNEAGADLFVELHWGWQGPAGPARRPAVSGDAFIEGLCDSTVSGFHHPTRFANLAIAAERAAREVLGGWIRLGDVHRIVTSVPMDWDAVVAAARRWRVRAPLYASLVAARELLATPVPRRVLQGLAPGPVRRRLLHRSLAACQGPGRRPRAAWAAHLLLADNWWDAARAAARTAAPRVRSHGQRGEAAVTQARFSDPLRVVAPRLRILPRE